MLGLFLINLHQEKAHNDPDDFAHTADDADEDAKGCRESKGCYGEDKVTLLHPQPPHAAFVVTIGDLKVADAAIRY